MLLSKAEVEKQSLLKEVFVMQGSAANTFLKYHRKLLFQQTRGLQKAQQSSAVRTAVRTEGGSGVWWMLEPLQGRWPVPLQLWLSQITDNASSSNQSSANIWKPRFQVVRLKG